MASIEKNGRASHLFLLVFSIALAARLALLVAAPASLLAAGSAELPAALEAALDGELAAQVFSGAPWSEPLSALPPLTRLLVEAPRSLLGDEGGLLAARTLSALLGALAASLFFLAFRVHAGQCVAFAFALALALWPEALWIDTRAGPAALAFALVAAACWRLALALRRALPDGALAQAGALLGLAALADGRALTLLFGAALGVSLVPRAGWEGLSRRRAFALVLVPGAALVLAFSLWLYGVHRDPVLVAEGGGVALHVARQEPRCAAGLEAALAECAERRVRVREAASDLGLTRAFARQRFFLARALPSLPAAFARAPALASAAWLPGAPPGALTPRPASPQAPLPAAVEAPTWWAIGRFVPVALALLALAGLARAPKRPLFVSMALLSLVALGLAGVEASFRRVTLALSLLAAARGLGLLVERAPRAPSSLAAALALAALLAGALLPAPALPPAALLVAERAPGGASEKHAIALALARLVEERAPALAPPLAAAARHALATRLVDAESDVDAALAALEAAAASGSDFARFEESRSLLAVRRALVSASAGRGEAGARIVELLEEAEDFAARLESGAPRLGHPLLDHAYRCRATLELGDALRDAGELERALARYAQVSSECAALEGLAVEASTRLRALAPLAAPPRRR